VQSDPIISSLDVERRITMAKIINDKLNSFCNHKDKRNTDNCRKIRSRFILNLSKHFSIEAPWLQKHIATCPRCQKRLATVSKVNLALSFIKSQSHNLDLLMRANTQAINVLKHSLREMPETQKLKVVKPEPRLRQKPIQCLQPSLNLAACILVLFLMKFGIFSSISKFETQGKKAYKQYFVSNIGEEMTEDIFPGEFS
jgi:hypothetical protein